MNTLTAEYDEALRQARYSTTDESTLAYLLWRYPASTAVAVAVAKHPNTGPLMLLWLERRGGEVRDAVLNRQQPDAVVQEPTEGVVLALPGAKAPPAHTAPSGPVQVAA